MTQSRFKTAPAPASEPGLVRAVAKRARLARSLAAFLRVLRLPDVHRGLIDYEVWPHIEALADEMQLGTWMTILKARQVGISWLLAAYMLWLSMYRPGSLVLAISKSQSDSDELLSKCLALYDNLDPSVCVAITRHSSASPARLEFENGSRILSFASTKDAGRGHTASLVVIDESAFHPWAAANYRAYQPTLSDGGQLLMVTTGNGPSGLFHALFTAAQRGANRFRHHFVPWFARPDRQNADGSPDLDWLAEMRDEYPGMPAEFRTEFPSSIDEAWTSQTGLVYGTDDDGVALFSAEQHPVGNIAPDPCSWEDCEYHYGYVDWGGGDPTAVGAIGVTKSGRIHKYAEHTWTTAAPPVNEIGDWLIDHWPENGYDSIECGADEPNAIATLVQVGLPAQSALTGRTIKGAAKTSVKAQVGAVGDVLGQVGRIPGAKDTGLAALKGLNYAGDVAAGSLLTPFTDPQVDEETGDVSRKPTIKKGFGILGQEALGFFDPRGVSGPGGALERDIAQEAEVLGEEAPGRFDVFGAISRAQRTGEDFQRSENIPAGIRTAVALGTDPLFYVGAGTFGKAATAIARSGKAPKGVSEALLKTLGPEARTGIGALLEGPPQSARLALLAGASAGSQAAQSGGIPGVDEGIERFLAPLLGGGAGGIAAARRTSVPGRSPSAEDVVQEMVPRAEGRRGIGGGELTGLSPGVRTNRQISELVKRAERMAEEGEEGRFWYENSGRYFAEMMNGDIHQADQMARIAAITSPQKTPHSQGPLILRAWSQYQKGEPLTGIATGPQTQRLEQALRGTQEEWDDTVVSLLKGDKGETGKKTMNFYLDLLDEIDPERALQLREAAGATLTVDLWMARAFGMAKDKVTPAQYRFIEESTAEVASRLGWKPKQVQAAIWVSERIKGESFNPKQDYASSLDRLMAQVSWESAPGGGTVSAGTLDGITSAPKEVQAEYHHRVHRAMVDEDGNDIVARLTKMPVKGSFEGPGVWKDPETGMVSLTPGSQTWVPIGAKAGGEVTGFVDPASRAHIEAYAAVMGELFQQSAVTWTRAFESPAKFLHNGVDIPLSRRVTNEEAASLSRLLQGDDELEIVILPIEDGVRIFYAPDDVLTTAKESATPEVRAVLQARRKDLLQRVSAAAEEVYPEFKEADASFHVRSFSTDGGYLENDWRSNPNAEAYRRLYSAFDGPDLRASMDKLRGRVDSINEEFASRYGWGGRIARGAEGKALDELSGVRSEPAGGAGAATRADGTEAEPTGGGGATGYYASGTGQPAEAIGPGSSLLGVQGPSRARPALGGLSSEDLPPGLADTKLLAPEADTRLMERERDSSAPKDPSEQDQP